MNIWKRHPSFGSRLVANGEYFHIRCGVPILNLVVHEGLKAIDGSLVRIGESVKYVRVSNARMLKFASCLEELFYVTC
uniref:Uncharacterized protein n=1 Tax=Cajanus cajan TaxID=3821 RepID=A0A151T931_CAJCA|nr:hypothetical protein KK1_018149 [Cajanus cajan]